MLLRAPGHPLGLLLTPLVLAGFGVAQTIYGLLLASPEFFSVRQLEAAHLWLLAALLSLALPLIPALPAWLARHRWPRFAGALAWLISGLLGGLFFAQLWLPLLGRFEVAHVLVSLLCGMALAWLLLFTRWSLLSSVLVVPALLFPAWFLTKAPAISEASVFPAPLLERKAPGEASPDIVFILWDELSLATLLSEDLQVDEALFPGFARLQSVSDWYIETTSVSPHTVSAVPAILTGMLPTDATWRITAADSPVNLFTLLAPHYRLNVIESSTRLCPENLCPRLDLSFGQRFKGLVLDLSAVFLHRVSPDRLSELLPEVSNNWGGFFAPQHVFFPEGWKKEAGRLTEMNRPAAFAAFTDSLEAGPQPTLNFMHLLFPHGPTAYLPDGRNYGHEWLRGRDRALWEEDSWGPLNSMQRHTLQVQYADRMLARLFERLDTLGRFDDSLIVVTSDHGASFTPGDWVRSTNGKQQASTLRVPLFIKWPGQKAGRVMPEKAMTVDILPTLLGGLGFAPGVLDIDGLDLQRHDPGGRKRTTMMIEATFGDVDEAALDLVPLIRENRRKLALDSPSRALWDIGPFGALHGQPLDAVCTQTEGDMPIYFDAFHPLPNTDPDEAVPAFVNGTFNGDDMPQAPTPFIISQQGTIVASGETWWFHDRAHFFVLVRPEWVTTPGWAPQAWLVEEGFCRGAPAPGG